MDKRGGGGELFQLDEVGAGGMSSLTAFLPQPPWSSSSSSTMLKQEPDHVVDTLPEAVEEEPEQEEEEEEEEEAALEMPPGFRFKPTDGEVIYYLEEKCANPTFRARAITEIDINNCEPWDLPNLAKMGEKEWYFFWKRDRKYPTGSRTNRATARGYWKATGKDKDIYRKVDMGSSGGSKAAGPIRCLVGMKKTLVFYLGRAPKGTKSNWVMHEYRRIPHAPNQHPTITPANGKKDWVVCRVFHKTAPDATSAARNDGSETPLTPVRQNPDQLPPTTYNYNQNYPYASSKATNMLLTPSNLPPLLDDYPSHQTPFTGTSSILASPALYGYASTRLAPPRQQASFYFPAEGDVHSMMAPALSSGRPATASAARSALLRGKCKAELDEYVTAVKAAAASPTYQLVAPVQDPCPGTSGSAGYDDGGACSPCSSSDGPLAGLEYMWDDY